MTPIERRLPVTVVGVNPTGVLAYVDRVRVRIRVREAGPPLWRCDAHPSDGRTTCPHIEALAAVHHEPTTKKESTTA